MNDLLASLLVRQHLALVDEGIGPKDPQDSDKGILGRAAEQMITKGDLTIHEAWDNYLISGDDPRHPSPCDEVCYPGWKVS